MSKCAGVTEPGELTKMNPMRRRQRGRRDADAAAQASSTCVVDESSGTGGICSTLSSVIHESLASMLRIRSPASCGVLKRGT